MVLTSSQLLTSSSLQGPLCLATAGAGAGGGGAEEDEEEEDEDDEVVVVVVEAGAAAESGTAMVSPSFFRAVLMSSRILIVNGLAVFSSP